MSMRARGAAKGFLNGLATSPSIPSVILLSTTRACAFVSEVLSVPAEDCRATPARAGASPGNRCCGRTPTGLVRAPRIIHIPLSGGDERPRQKGFAMLTASTIGGKVIREETDLGTASRAASR